ncbi:MAG: hypothetical protein DIU74_012320 [Pseudomonadota bacterium]|nr:MAG: hypothetical protein DIU74_08825 [Pseudomonadota bacterium]
MDQDKARSILKALAEGLDPRSGEAFPADSPYQHPDVIRALYAALEAMHPRADRRDAPRRSAPGNAGKPWSKEEDERLLAAFAAGLSIEALAAQHGRSRTGIEARLAKYGKVPPPAALPSTRLRGAQPASPTA